jgi:hypothetical protein
MGIDEPGNGDQPPAVDFRSSAVFLVGADDDIVANGNIALVEGAGRDIEKTGALYYQIGLGSADGLINAAPETVPSYPMPALPAGRPMLPKSNPP